MSAEFFDQIIKVVELLVLPFAWYIVNSLKDLSKRLDEVATEARELKVVLIGVDGRNGMRSRFSRVERRVEQLVVNEASASGANKRFQDHEEEE